MLRIKKAYMTENPCYRTNREIVPKGLMLHSVGCAQSRAEVFFASWNRREFKTACVHAFIDGNTGIVWQSLPWDHRGWHCGGSANNTHIGVEMCEPDSLYYTGGSTFTCRNLERARACAARTYQSAVELFAYLCSQYDLDPCKDGVIISHKEGHTRGVATDHGDPEHLWQGLGLPYTMNGFRQDVSAMILENSRKGNVFPEEETPISNKDDKSEELAHAEYRFREQKEAPAGTPVEPYLVRVERDNLYLRGGPGTDFVRFGFIPRGVYTIIAETDGIGAERWGRLKSGAGWIALEYTARL